MSKPIDMIIGNQNYKAIPMSEWNRLNSKDKLTKEKPVYEICIDGIIH